MRCEALSRSPHPLSLRCTRPAKEQVRGHWYCVEHARIYPELWETHDRIVERIRNIRPRRLQSDPSTRERCAFDAFT